MSAGTTILEESAAIWEAAENSRCAEPFHSAKVRIHYIGVRWMAKAPTVDRTADTEGAAAEAFRIGRRLRALRSDRGLTILELAAKAGVSSGNISQIERGNSNP